MLKKTTVLLLTLMIGAGLSWATPAKGDLEQTIIKVGEDIEIARNDEVQSAVSIGGSVRVYGKVAEDVVAVGGSVVLEDWALVGGDAVAVGGSVNKAPRAIVKGDVVEVAVPGIAPMVEVVTQGGIFKGWAVFSLVSFLAFLVLVMVLVALFKAQIEKTSAAVGKYLVKSFLFGLLIILIFVPVIILLVISIAGIVLVPVWMVIAAAAGLFGYVASGHYIGEKVLKAFKLNVKTAMVKTLTGVILLALVGLVPVAGFVVKAVITTMGLGAVVLTRFGTQKA